jgi:hypothetical protein
MPSEGFQPAIPASERPQIHALDSTATGIGILLLLLLLLIIIIIIIIIINIVVYTHTCQLVHVSLCCSNSVIYEVKNIRMGHAKVSVSNLEQVTPRYVGSESDCANKKHGV